MLLAVATDSFQESLVTLPEINYVREVEQHIEAEAVEAEKQKKKAAKKKTKKKTTKKRTKKKTAS